MQDAKRLHLCPADLLQVACTMCICIQCKHIFFCLLKQALSTEVYDAQCLHLGPTNLLNLGCSVHTCVHLFAEAQRFRVPRASILSQPVSSQVTFAIKTYLYVEGTCADGVGICKLLAQNTLQTM